MQKTLFRNARTIPPPLLCGDPATTERSLRLMQRRGFYAANVERMDKFLHKHDAFGFIDVLAFRPGAPFVAVQSCQRGEERAHLRKYRQWPKIRDALLAWLADGRALVIHAWQAAEKRSKRTGKTKIEWHVVERIVTAEDLDEAKF